MEEIYQKLDSLKQYIEGLGSLAVAFSGGVDSTFLLQVAHEVLGEKAAAVTARTASYPEREWQEAKAFCEERGIKQYDIFYDELAIEGFRQNLKNRCYHCKKALFDKILVTAQEHQLAYVAEGSNIDDNGDYRPGLQAVAELQIKSPLREAGLTKEEIRRLSKEMGLPTWQKPAFACLASRFVYGEGITAEKLDMVGKAEQLLIDLGFRQCRVRIHEKMARIELLPEAFERFMQEDIRKKVVAELKKYGFSYVALDLVGYRTGSMNETLENVNN